MPSSDSRSAAPRCGELHERGFYARISDGNHSQICFRELRPDLELAQHNVDCGFIVITQSVSQSYRITAWREQDQVPPARWNNLYTNFKPKRRRGQSPSKRQRPNQHQDYSAQNDEDSQQGQYQRQKKYKETYSPRTGRNKEFDSLVLLNRNER